MPEYMLTIQFAFGPAAQNVGRLMAQWSPAPFFMDYVAQRRHQWNYFDVVAPLRQDFSSWAEPALIPKYQPREISLSVSLRRQELEECRKTGATSTGLRSGHAAHSAALSLSPPLIPYATWKTHLPCPVAEPPPRPMVKPLPAVAKPRPTLPTTLTPVPRMAGKVADHSEEGSADESDKEEGSADEEHERRPLAAPMWPVRASRLQRCPHCYDEFCCGCACMCPDSLESRNHPSDDQIR
ncbi:hypothetical protein B0H14DRAFT_2568335 [Mycena olivaceomarginata]|nr:hypothetical protein B0H14DRAFT_2568335 [Mycena olivaceomarginata]